MLNALWRLVHWRLIEAVQPIVYRAEAQGFQFSFGLISALPVVRVAQFERDVDDDGPVTYSVTKPLLDLATLVGMIASAFSD